MKKLKQINATGKNTFASWKLLFFIIGVLFQSHLFAQTTQTFTSSGTFTVPAGVTTVQVEAWGGGGGGGGVNGSSSQTRAGGGGAGGAYVKNISFGVTPGANISVTVGSGGDGDNGDDGENGGASIFGSVTANGGIGGKVGESGNPNGAGAPVTSGTFNGGSGAAASGGNSGGGGGGAGSTGAGGNASGTSAGAAGAGGGGAGGAGRTSSGDGNDAAGLSGGGGGGRSSSSTDRRGGDGFRGQVKITYTCSSYTLATTSGATPVCASSGTSLISVTASAAALPAGTYTVTYNRSSPSATGLTAAMTVSAAGSGSFTATGLTTAGTPTITITNLISAGCNSTVSSNNTAVIAVNAAPSANASNNGPICSGNSLNLSSNSTGVTYQWSGPASFSSTLQNPSRPNALTTYGGTYTLTVTSTTTGCTASTTTAATVNATPAASANNNGPGCVGSTLNLSGGPGSQASYSWVGPNGYTSSSQNPSRSNAQISYSGTYTLTVTSSAGCSSSASTNATVNALPVASASNSSPDCHGGTLNLTSSGGASYSWSGPNSFSSTSQNPSIISFAGKHTGTYTVTVTASGCTATATTSAAIKALPVPTASVSSASVCPGSVINLTASPNATIRNNASFAIPDNNSTGGSSPIVLSGFSPATIVTGTIKSVNFSITHSYDGDLTIYLVSPGNSQILLVNRRGGNSNNFTNTTIVNSGGANGNVSAGSAPFTGTYNTENAFSGLNGANTNGIWKLKTVDNANGDVGTITDFTLTLVSNGTTYSWTSSASGFTSSLQNPTDAPVSATTYTVVASLAGCTGSASAAITTLAIPVPNASSNAPVCSGAGLMLFGNNYAAGQSTGNSWSWTGPAFSSALQNPAIGGVSSGTAGSYTLIVTNSFGCTASATASVVINPNPVLSIGTQNDVSCNGLFDGQVDIEASNGTPLYLFDLNGSSTLDGIYSGLAAGTYNASVIDDNGCEAAPFNVIITEPAVLSVTAGSNSPVCDGTTLNLSSIPVGGTAGYSYSWTGPDNFSSANPNPSVSSLTNTGAGQYLLQITDAHGCTADANTAVNIALPPIASASLIGNPNICIGQAITVQLAFTGTGPWNYTVSDGSQTVNGTSLITPVNVSITPSTPGTHTYLVTSVTDAYCNTGGTSSGSAIVAVTSSAPSNNIGSINAPSSACNGDVMSISTNNVNGQNIHYSWNTGSYSSVVKFSSNSSGPFVSGPFETTTENVYAQFGALVGSSGYTICVKAINPCGITNNKCTWIRGVVSVPGSISGSVVACSGDTKSYSAGISAGASVYNWSFSVPGAVINNNGTANVTVTFPAFTAGQLCVTASLSCGGSSVSAPRCVNISNSPAFPGTMTGPKKVCPGATNIEYSVPLVPGTSGYNWTVPPGASIVETPPYTNSIHVNFPVPYNNSPPVCVTAFSPCGLSPVRCKSVSSSIPLIPQPITGPTTGVCNSTIQYSVANVAGATSYTWLVPTGATNLIGQGTTSIQFDMPAPFSSGYVRVAANNNSCTPANGPYRSLVISGAPLIPTAIIPLGEICDYQFASVYVDPVISATSYNWTLTNGSIDYGQGTNNIDLTWGSGAGTIKVRAANACGLSGLRILDITPACRIAELNYDSDKGQEGLKLEAY
ncbi:MAG TPA: proprotein convertase P-domain-containing protein, partial [Bacteroidia bacterium]|nr:proprotein convertase P-domain-containing protein [Bacteroidia bacterium]